MLRFILYGVSGAQASDLPGGDVRGQHAGAGAAAAELPDQRRRQATQENCQYVHT